MKPFGSVFLVFSGTDAAWGYWSKAKKCVGVVSFGEHAVEADAKPD